ncbi:hypothetical protein VTL71DRAFT_5783 [Oculimacula yallundae]|uniref:Uncharacterized protein n=1 Tax=Oculimacula yallundae TaxID=86028 RepID=A0ABR4BYG8_9HELO
MPPNVEETDGDAIEYAPPYDKDSPPPKPSFITSYYSPSPEPEPEVNHGPDIKPPPPAKRRDMPVAESLQSLLELPILRPIPWREGQELPPDKSYEHERAEVRIAVIMTTRGDIAEEPCQHCARGNGRFTECVYKEGWFLGACASCYFKHQGNLCSFRFEQKAEADAIVTANGKAKAQSPGDTIHVNGPSKKRKRKSTTKATAHKQPRTSGYEDSHSTVAEEESYAYEKSFDDDPNALLQYVYNQQHTNTSGGNKRHHQQYLAERDEKEARAFKSNGHGARRGSYRGEVGEGSFSPAMPYGTRERSSFNESNLAGAYSHRESRGALPQADEPLALIDTFPRKKQKQLFAAIGSLQSGIRNSRQQTENLQRQLDSLQHILGIEPEEDEYN